MRPNKTKRNAKKVPDQGFEPLEDRRMMTADPVMPPAGITAQADTWSETAWPNDVRMIRNEYGLTGAGQTVAIIDSGIAYDHYALGGGFGSDYRVVGGWDFAENDADPYDDDPAGFHGTHVAGIIGSSDSQYQGVASGVDMVALRVFDDHGTSTFQWIEQALVWVDQNQHAFEHPITTVNMSLGSALNDANISDWTILEDDLARLKAKGIFISVSAGNHFEGTLDLTYPAASEHVVPVGSVDASGEMSSFSQRNQRILAAPGQMITSTVPDYLFGFDGTTDDFLSVSGTSAAAPHVAGAGILVREALEFAGNSNVDQTDIYQHLRNTADIIYDSETDAQYLRVNLSRALEEALPRDVHGDTAATATDLGDLRTTRVVDSAIERIQDTDYFTLTASETGTISIDVSSTSLDEFTLVGNGVTSTSGTLNFNVMMGESVSFAIQADVGIGHYSAVATLVPRSITSSPAIPSNSMSESHVRWIPTQTGFHQIDLTFGNPDLVAEVVMHDGSQAVVYSNQNPQRSEQLAISVDAIQPYEIVVRGVDARTSMTVHNVGISAGGGGGSDSAGRLATVGDENTDQAIERFSSDDTMRAIRAFANSPLPSAYVEEAMDYLFADLKGDDACKVHCLNSNADARRASVDVVGSPEDGAEQRAGDAADIDRVIAEVDLDGSFSPL